MSKSSRDLAIHSKTQIGLDTIYLDRGLKLQSEIEKVLFHCTHAEIAGERLLLLEWPIVELVSKKYNDIWSTYRMREFALHSFSLEGEYIETNYFPLLDFKDQDTVINDSYSSLNFIGSFLVLYESVFHAWEDDSAEEVVAQIFDLSGRLKAVKTSSERIAEHLPYSQVVAKNVDVNMDLPSEFRFGKLGKNSTLFHNAKTGFGSKLYVYDHLPWSNSTSIINSDELRSSLQSMFRLTRNIRDAHCDESELWILEEDGLLSYQQIATDPENHSLSNIALAHCEGQLLEFYLAGTAEILALDRSISSDTIPLINEGKFSYFFIDRQQQIVQMKIHLQEKIRGHVVKHSSGYSYSIERLTNSYALSNGLLSFNALTSLGTPCTGTLNLHTGQITAFFPKIPRARRLASPENITVWIDD